MSVSSSASLSSMNGSRLVRALTDMAVSDVPISHKHFIGRLARFINMTDSITLSDTLGKRVPKAFEAMSDPCEALTREFLTVQAALLALVVESFSAGASRFPLPILTAESLSDTRPAFEPIHRFYAAHQREFELSIARLQTQVRDAVAGMSPDLARLVDLDRTLGNLLLAPGRRLLALTPRLLNRRFEVLLALYRQRDPHGEIPAEQWMQPGGWLAQFYQEAKGILLAELEVRLLPVLGLLEAADGHNTLTTQVVING